MMMGQWCVVWLGGQQLTGKSQSGSVNKPAVELMSSFNAVCIPSNTSGKASVHLLGSQCALDAFSCRWKRSTRPLALG